MENWSTSCVIAGGGPAGMMLGLLLARAGVPVVVLEKHADFLRDFRGDTIHPSTLRVMAELGLAEELLTLPHRKVAELKVQLADGMTTIGQFGRLRKFPYLAFMPQWDFLNFIATHAAAYPTFTLVHHAEVTGLIEDGDRVVGVHVTTPDGRRDIRATVVVGADGRHSVVRQAAGLPQVARSAPMDVLWFRMSRRPADPEDTFGVIRRGRFVAMINRTTYWQIAYLVPKGAAGALRAEPIERFRAAVGEHVPFLADRTGELGGWDDVSVLEVRVDRLRRWYRPGLLCIGDAAHAMSPIGGVGINLAVQDAVAAANALAGPLAAGGSDVGLGPLRAVQRRRELPTRITQAVQVLIQRRVISPLMHGAGEPVRLPLLARLVLRIPLTRAVPALLFGRGVRLERVHTPKADPADPADPVR
ncbi:MAG TPA: FAD-dependent oxidoreductase [Mycobacteriales bacterium]|nr:FAD-dependent oxidoreductase [Mycobacteriales bacterium]